MTETELGPVESLAAQYGVRLIQHDANDPDQLITKQADVGGLGQMRLPASFHRDVVEADRLVLVGTVEPHQYAGFSGGAKTVGIGCASRETISAMHGLTFLREPATALGRIDGNPFQEALWRLVDRLPSMDALQLVPGTDGSVAFATFDRCDRAFRRAVDVAHRGLFESYDGQCSWLHLLVPSSKAKSFYQASRAASYAGLVERPVVKEGGTLLVEAPCPEGNGTGPGERCFERAMFRGSQALLARLRSEEASPLEGGEQRAFVLARLLERFRVVLLGAPPVPGLAEMGVQQFVDLSSACLALNLDDDGRTITDVFRRLPVLQRS